MITSTLSESSASPASLQLGWQPLRWSERCSKSKTELVQQLQEEIQLGSVNVLVLAYRSCLASHWKQKAMADLEGRELFNGFSSEQL